MLLLLFDYLQAAHMRDWVSDRLLAMAPQGTLATAAPAGSLAAMEGAASTHPAACHALCQHTKILGCSLQLGVAGSSSSSTAVVGVQMLPKVQLVADQVP